MNPDRQLREIAQHYDKTDLSEHIEQATWEERLTLQTVGEEATVPVSALLALVAERGTGQVPDAS